MRSRSELSRLAAALGGLPVLGSLAGSPAAQAGIRYGDVLLAIDGMRTSNWNEFLEARSRVRGQFVARIFREGAELEIAIVLRPSHRSPGEILAELLEQRVVDGDGGESGAAGDDGGGEIN